MKKLAVISGAIVIVMLLLWRLYSSKATAVAASRVPFVKGLNYKFSATVDSVVVLNGDIGLILFHTPGGNRDFEVENSLNRELDLSAELKLIIPRPNNAFLISTQNVKRVNIGNLLVVDADAVRYYNNDALLFTEKATGLLKWSPVIRL